MRIAHYFHISAPCCILQLALIGTFDHGYVHSIKQKDLHTLSILSLDKDSLPKTAIALGFISGMRSVAGITFLSDAARRGSIDVGKGQLSDLVKSEQATQALKLAALGEIAADKLPFMPKRTSFIPLVGRVVIGSVVGALSSKEDRLRGGIAGGVAALVATVLLFQVRRLLSKRIPDPILGVAEDASVVMLAKSLLPK